MKIKKSEIFITILLSCFISSCGFFNLDYYDEQLKLTRIKKSLPDSIWLGFPDKIDSSTRVITAYNPAVLKHNLNYYGIFIKEALSPKEFQNKINFLKKNAIFKKSINEISDSQINDSIFFFDIKGEYGGIHPQGNIKYIVPSYSTQFSPIDGLISRNSQIMVLNSEFGLFNNNEYLSYSRSLNKHGSSKGVYYNNRKHRIIYWIILW